MPYASQRAVTWEHRLQRAGFVCFVAFVLAAVTGLLGDRARIVVATTAIYLLLLVVFRIAGRRTLAKLTSFDLVLLLIIGETTQQAMMQDDKSIMGAVVAILSLVSLDMAMAYLKTAFPSFDRLMEGEPVLLIDNGKVHTATLRANSLDHDDIKEAARLSHGLSSMEDVRQATLERDGHISIVPWRNDAK
jgi:uncharacterized membrane protein YcaP (DUF421 family)